MHLLLGCELTSPDGHCQLQKAIDNLYSQLMRHAGESVSLWSTPFIWKVILGSLHVT